MTKNNCCHPERTVLQASFGSGAPADRSSSAGWSLGVVSRKLALSEAEGDLPLFLHELQRHHTRAYRIRSCNESILLNARSAHSSSPGRTRATSTSWPR